MNTDTPETDAHVLETLHNSMTDILGRFNLLLPFTRKLERQRRNLERQRNNTLALLEREQMRLVACDVIAMCDTPESAAEARQMHSDYESAALGSVKRRVDECIALRQMVRELRDALQRVADNGHAEDCLLLNRANAECDCGVDAAYLLITKANQLLP